jgi:hypothetical protein
MRRATFPEMLGNFLYGSSKDFLIDEGVNETKHRISQHRQTSASDGINAARVIRSYRHSNRSNRVLRNLASSLGPAGARQNPWRASKASETDGRRCRRSLKMAKSRKFKKGSTHLEFAPVVRALAKKKGPRGVPFVKGNPIGKETRFVKGAPSANPGGRPKTARLNQALREALALDSGKRLPTGSNAQVIASKIIYQAKKGNLQAAICAGDRAEGRPNVSISLDDSRDKFDILIESMTRRSVIAGPADESGEEESSEDDEYAPRLLGAGEEDPHGI